MKSDFYIYRGINSSNAASFNRPVKDIKILPGEKIFGKKEDAANSGDSSLHMRNPQIYKLEIKTFEQLKKFRKNIGIGQLPMYQASLSEC